MAKKDLAELLDYAYRQTGPERTVFLADSMRSIGYQFGTKAGISIAMKDMEIPEGKHTFIEKAFTEVPLIENQYTEGLSRTVNVITKLSISGRKFLRTLHRT